jgi:hypothetical protein
MNKYIESGILSPDPENNYYVVWSCAVVNPQNLPYRPSGTLFFTRKKDAKEYGEAMYPNVGHKPQVFRYSSVIIARVH